MENKITSIIVDDEKNSREVLRELLAKFFNGVEVLGEARDVEDAHKLIESKHPQLVFLDIEMPRGKGFDLLKKYEKAVPFEVIFITSYDHYAINAIKFNALDYLLKPVEIKDLKEAIDKVKRTISLKQKQEVQIINLLHSLEKDHKDLKLAVHHGDVVKMLNTADIIYIESDGRYCNVVTQTKERFTLAKYVKDFEEYFGEDSGFIRVHKSYLINVNHIKEYSKGDPFIIVMSNGESIEVSRRKKPEVLEKLRA